MVAIGAPSTEIVVTVPDFDAVTTGECPSLPAAPV